MGAITIWFARVMGPSLYGSKVLGDIEIIIVGIQKAIKSVNR
jgi:hypothetical protein